MRPYVSACVATLESVTLLLFVFTNTSSGFVRHFSVAGARNALHGWCAWCRGPRSSRTSLTFSSRCASIREPTCHRTHLRPISICPGRSLLPSMRHWDTDPACPPSSPSSFSFRHSVHEELPGATSKCRRVHRPGGQRALLDPPRHDARVPGAHLVRPPRRNSVRLFLFITVWAIVLITPCFIYLSHHRANKIPNKPTSLRKSMKAAEAEMKAKKNE